MNGRAFVSATEDFRRARRRAALQSVLARLSGRPTNPLSFEEVKKQLKVAGEVPRGLQDIPLERIIGSVGRYRDFTRDFLPLGDNDAQRWARVKTVMNDAGGLPPIEVYKLGDVYFVKDGNHRVSVARRIGAETIEAYVTEVRTRVPLSPNDTPDDLILKAEYTDFLSQTRLDELRPNANLTLTAPGGHKVLLEHIAVHRYFMGLDEQRDVPGEEAVTHWYDTVYQPVVGMIHETGVLRDFSGRTEADLYLWLSEHRAALERALDWPVSLGAAAEDLMTHTSPQRARGSLTTAEPRNTLWNEILVAVSGTEAGWAALSAALTFAKLEGATLYGLHVLPGETHREGEKAQTVQREFAKRCETAGVPGRLALTVGRPPQVVVSRSRWIDLSVLSVSYPPPEGTLARVGSGLRLIIRRSPKPLLLVPPDAKTLNTLPKRALLAYDGSPKAQEALYAAAYLAGRWHVALGVLTAAEAQGEAKAYLKLHGLEATFVTTQGSAAQAVLREAEAGAVDLIVMGAYGSGALLEAALGSTVDAVLRARRWPVLVCP